MTFKQLQDEAILLRFNEGNRASVKSWLNLRYAAIWAKADWHFKHVRNQNVSVTASDPTPTIPNDFAKSEGIYDGNGDALTYLTPREFDGEAYQVPATTAPTPGYFTIVDRELWLFPTPPGTATYKLSYLRRLAHIDSGTGLAAAGVMVNDSDSPIWDAEYDYLLVLEAVILGCQVLEFPYADLVAQRDEILAAMIADLVGGQQGELQQWGDSCW